MTYHALPWDASGGSPIYDAADFKDLFKTLTGSTGRLANAGVIPSSIGSLRVVASNPASLTVHVEPGYALINGLYAGSDTTVDLTLDAADPVYARYDLVVFRADLTGKTASVELIKGTALGGIPSPTQNSTRYEIPLALIHLASGVTALNQPSIQPLAIALDAASCEVQMCRVADGSNDVMYGSVVCWAPPEYPTVNPASLAGYSYNEVSTLLHTRGWVAGIALASGTAGETVPVLTRGVWLSGSADAQQTINPSDLVSVSYNGVHITSEFVLHQNYEVLPLGYALQWVRTGVGETQRLAVFVDSSRFMTFPRWQSGGGAGSNLTNNTAGSWSDVAPSMSVYMYSRTRFLELKVNLVCSNSAAANRTKLTLSIDGVDQEVLWDQASPVANYRQMCGLNVMIDLGANFNTFHTLKLRWQPTAGTSTIYGAAGEVAPKIWLRELMEEKFY